MRRSRIYRTTVLAAGIGVALCAGSASAGIGVSPLKQEVVVKPGQAGKFYISIANTARNKWDTAQSVHLEVMDFSVSEGGGLIFEPPGTAKHSASKWITLDKSDLTLAPGKGEKVECTVKVPHSAVGEYYSAVMVTLGKKSKVAGGVMVGYRTASGVFLTIAGRTFPPKARITRCEVVWPEPPVVEPGAARPPAALKAEPLRVLAVLKNTGRARFEASGKLRITDPKGRIVYRTPMTTKRARILADDTRVFEGVLDKALPQGQYTVKVEMDYQSKWAKAKARLPLTVSAEQAALLAGIADRIRIAGEAKTSRSVIEVAPEKLTATIPPGGFWSLKVVVENRGKRAVQGTATVVGEGKTPIPASWMTLGPDKLTLGGGRSRTLLLMVRVPSDAAGLYSGTLIVEGLATDGTKSVRKIPVALTIGAGK